MCVLPASSPILITDYNPNKAIDYIRFIVIITKKTLKNVNEYEQITSVLLKK